MDFMGYLSLKGDGVITWGIAGSMPGTMTVYHVVIFIFYPRLILIGTGLLLHLATEKSEEGE